MNNEDSFKFKNIDNSPVKFNLENFFNDKLNQKVEREIKKINQRIYEISTSKTKEIQNIKLAKSLFDQDDKDYDYLLDIAEEEANKNMYCNFNEYVVNDLMLENNNNILINIEKYYKVVKNEIKTKFENYREKLLSKFHINLMKTSVSINEIIEVLFNNKDEMIFYDSIDFIKILTGDTDRVIEKEMELDIERKFKDENENYNFLVDLLKSMKLNLSRFKDLKIIKHQNLDEYIDYQIEKFGTAFSKYISFIEEKESLKFPEFNFDCHQNELIAEICFLLMVKIYEKELQFLCSKKNEYEKEIVKNLIFEEMCLKMKEMRKLFEERFSGVNSNKITKLIENNSSVKGKKSKFSIEIIKHILDKINDENINLTQNEKLNVLENLFYQQNTKKY